MKPLIYSLAILVFAVSFEPASAQVQHGLTLQPEKMKGNRFLKRNIAFGGYKTIRLRRTIGSYFSSRSLNPFNHLEIEGVPVYHKDKRRSKDNFHFGLEKDGDAVSYIDVQAVLTKNETFRLFGKQDSSFFGKKNVDLLLASIQLDNNESTWWEMAAYNLNGSKDEPQRGVIKNGSQEISFEKTTMLLREAGNDIDNLFPSLYMVYAFRYNNEIISAITYKRNDRICWVKEGLGADIETVIASAMSVLKLRRDIYR